MTSPRLERCPGLDGACSRAAQLTAQALADACAARGHASLALSGGSTPGAYFRALTASGLSVNSLAWPSIDVFWADERLCPPDAPESNYRLARENLLARIAGEGPRVHPMPTDAPDLDAAVAQARAMLAAAFPGGGVPVFDVIHLGLGPDGHTASLFPGDPALEETAWVAGVPRPGLDPRLPRLTLTLPVINAARLVIVLAAGADKLRLAGDILAGRRPELPAARLRPAGELVWLIADI